MLDELYYEGYLNGLSGNRNSNPYKEGTAKAKAYDAGYNEGVNK